MIKRQESVSQGAVASRRYPVGAEVLADGKVAFRVWAPSRKRAEVVFTGAKAFELSAEGNGYFSGATDAIAAGGCYSFRLDGEQSLYPDPASRFQPEGPHGPSQVVDCRGFSWSDGSWSGVSSRGQVIYEMHFGTFTPEGTYAAATQRLRHLRDIGVTLVEVMPVHEFPGRFGWGYDGVDLWAPTRLYGTPEDLRAFVDRAHAEGLGVILDVVYNHFGPDGNYLKAFSPEYFTDRYSNEWGEAINFDGTGAQPVREFFVENAGYWIDEFHFDGLRLDATQSIVDSSPEHVLSVLAKRVRAAAPSRQTYLVAENEPQHTKLVRSPEAGGYGLDALWNDDFHHSALVSLTGRREAYYTDYGGSPQELISALRWGYLYQGQHYKWQKKRRGTPSLDLLAENFVLYLENHDQVANSGTGARLSLLTSPARLRAITALFLLAPGTPMLFQGQEFGSSRPFFYFADHNAELATLVKKGRAEFLAQFPSLSSPAVQKQLTDPSAEATFNACKLDWTERDSHTQVASLYRDLLALRKSDPAFAQQRADRVHGAILGERALALRYICPSGDRLVILNLGTDRFCEPVPEPLLAPPDAQRWHVLWSSEEPAYGGAGTPEIETDAGWNLPSDALVVLTPEPIPNASTPDATPAHLAKP